MTNQTRRTSYEIAFIVSTACALECSGRFSIVAIVVVDSGRLRRDRDDRCVCLSPTVRCISYCYSLS